MRNSFSKEFHLLTAADFNYLLRGSLTHSNRFFRFYFKKTRIQDSTHARLGISVSKKVGKAFERNLIKRYIREAFRVSDVKARPLDVLVVASPRIDVKMSNSKYLQSCLLESMNKHIKLDLES